MFYLLDTELHPIRDYGHPGNLIPPALTLAKLGCTPLTLDQILGGRGAPWAVFGPPAGAVMKKILYIYMSQ